jgi:hypothetical protein
VVLLLTGQSPATQEAKRGFSVGVRPGARSAFVDLGARF